MKYGVFLNDKCEQEFSGREGAGEARAAFACVRNMPESLVELVSVSETGQRVTLDRARNH